MRSSIACSRCRRSKTKCDNNGVRDITGALAPCKSCVASKKICDYPAPQPAAASNYSQRRESTVTTAGEEAPPKKRKRPIVPTAGTMFRSKGRLGALEDALESPLLTPRVWDELWAIHEKHYATEFSFLHKRTFLGPLQRLPPVSSSEKGSDPQRQRSHDPALVLAFLTQTSPFHPELVAQTDSPYDTAEFYAAATRRHLNYDFSGEGETALQQIQAFLMLGYHEWTACHSRNGYMLIRTAVNFAQMNDYQYDEELDKGNENDDAASKRDRFIRQESRRRTFWSCFILDRYLSVGRRRPKILQVDDLRGTIQVPCSDKNFISGRAVKTRFFGETDTEYEARRRSTREEALRRQGGQKSERIEWEDREDDGVLGRYIYALDHFSDVTIWANKGGRRSEPANIGPWNPATTYYKLDKRLREIKEDLPDELRLTSLNTENHIYGAPSGTSRTYFLIHAILTLSTTYLAPEYLATFPFRTSKPQGPLDEPLVTEPLPPDQPNYWVEKATECFEYVRDFVSILQSFKDRNLVVESPFIGHAVYKAAWCAIYCHYVPRMDPTHALDSRLEPNAWDITNQVMDSMKLKFRIANIMSIELARVKAYYTKQRKEYRRVGGSPESTTSDHGGGLKIYSELFEAPHKQFGSLQHDKTDLTQPNDKPYSKLEHEEESEDPTTSHSPDVPFKTEGEEPRRSNSTATSTNSTTFTPVNPNNATTPVQMESMGNASNTSNGNRSSYGSSIPQGPQQPQPSQTYPGQPLQYGQSPGYGYAPNAQAYLQPTSRYDQHLPYARNSGPGQVSSSSSYDAQALINLEREGNRSICNTNLSFFEGEWNNQQSVLAPDYPYDQLQAQVQYMPDSQGSYIFTGQWNGQG